MAWHGAIEVIYVDSDSTDGSVAVAQSLGATVLPVHPARPTAALGRNAGWRQAKGELVLFLDGDTILHPRFVIDSVSHFQNAEIAVVWGHRREIHPDASLFNRVLDLDWIYRPGPSEFCGGDALFRHSALTETGGFDERLIAGEEPELCARFKAKGWHILHVDRPMTGHDLAIYKLSQYWNRAIRAGYAYAEVSERFKNARAPFWERDATRNRNRAVGLTALVATGLLLSVVTKNSAPLALAFLFLGALVLRTAWKARWKSSDLVTCFFYGVHSQIQQIPIYLGQLQFQNDKRIGRRRGLIEYKSTP